jgi:flagellar basal body-associated protein FliL
MRSGRGKIIAIIVVVALAIGGLVAWQVMGGHKEGGGDKKDEPAPTAPAGQ